MEKMKFHWEKGNKKRSFTITAFSVDERIKIAEKGIRSRNG
ncbi:hypothetical protein [Peribacillus loiseleuriae]